MSRVGDVDEVLEVPPLGMETAEELGEAILSIYQPEALEGPTCLDTGSWIERRLPPTGVHVYPRDDAEMPDMEGYTDADECTHDERIIVIRESYWDEAFAGGRRAHRAKSTVFHELGHAILHIPYLLRRRAAAKAPGELALRRAAWREVPAFKNAEWQAWAIAGSVAMPRRTLAMLPRVTVEIVAEVYGVSHSFARSHLKRLKIG